MVTLSVRLSVRPSVTLSRAMFRRWYMHSSECCHYFSTTFCYKVWTLRRDPSEVIWRGWLVRLLKLAYLRRLRKANFGKKSFRNSAKKCNMSPGVHISPVILISFTQMIFKYILTWQPNKKNGESLIQRAFTNTNAASLPLAPPPPPRISLSKWSEFNKSGGPAGHQVRILWGPAEIYTLPVRMSDTIFLQY